MEKKKASVNGIKTLIKTLNDVFENKPEEQIELLEYNIGEYQFDTEGITMITDRVNELKRQLDKSPEISERGG